MRTQLNRGTIINALLALSLATNAYLFTSLRTHGDEEMSRGDRRIAERALNERAGQESVPLATIERLNRATVVHFSQETCVELSPAAGVVGGSTIFCYDKRTEAPTRNEKVGE